MIFVYRLIEKKTTRSSEAFYILFQFCFYIYRFQKKTCTLDFDTRDIPEGYHAVNVVIEDYVRPVKRRSKPLSEVSLLFLLYVERESTSCMKPDIIDPPTCMSIQPNKTFEMVVRADPGDPLTPYVAITKSKTPYLLLFHTATLLTKDM